MNDSQLLTAYAGEGSEEAFRAIVGRYIDMVYGAALRKSESPEMAEDVTQAVFIVLARRAGRIRRPELLAGWLLQTVRYCAADARRSAARRRVHEAEAAMAQPRNVEAATDEETGKIVKALDGALERLGPADRAAIVLRFYQNQSSAQIGESLGISEEAVRKRQSRALEKLRKYFAHSGVVFSAAVVTAAISKQAVAAPAGLPEKSCAAALAKGASVGAAAAIATGAMKIMAWSGAKTAAAGVAVVVLLAGTTFVMARRGMPERRVAAAPAPASAVPVSAPAAAGVTFVVRDVSGRPVSNAYAEPDGTNIAPASQTDRDGRVTFSSLDPEVRQFVFESNRSRRMAIYTLLPGEAAGTHEVTLDCFSAGANGIVTDASGNPVRGATVKLFVATPDGQVFHFDAGKSDENGYFFGKVPARKGLTCWAAASTDPADASSTPHVALGEQYEVQLADLVIRTDIGAAKGTGVARMRYAGRVVDESGKAIPNAELEFDYPKNHMSYTAGDVLTDAEGRFLALLPPDANRVDMELTAAGFISHDFEQTPLPSEEALKNGTAVIVMKRGVALEGTVRDAVTNEPVFNALVAAGSTGRMGEGEIVEDFTTPRTDKAGYFRATGLPAGKRSVQVLADGYAPQLMEADVANDGKPLEIRLEKGLTYSAQIVDANGEGLEGVRLSTRNWQVGHAFTGIRRVVRTDAEGRFTVSDLPREGRVDFYLGKKGYVSEDGAWQAGGKNLVVLPLYASPVVKGIVLDDQTGDPVTKFTAYPAWYVPEPSVLDFNRAKKVNNPQGKFSVAVSNFGCDIEHPTPVAARIVADGYVPQFTQPVALDGKTGTVTVRLKRAAPIAGVVVDAAGSAVEGARVWLIGPKERAVVDGVTLNEFMTGPKDSTKTDAVGEFKLPPAEGAGALLVLGDAGYGFVADTTKFTEGQALRLTPWETVEGTLESGGKPANGIALQLRPAYGEKMLGNSVDFTLNATTDVTGHFRIEHVPAFAYVVSGADQGVPSSEKVQAEAGKTTTVAIKK